MTKKRKDQKYPLRFFFACAILNTSNKHCEEKTMITKLFGLGMLPVSITAIILSSLSLYAAAHTVFA